MGVSLNVVMLYKPDMKPYKVYHVRQDQAGYPLFLIYRNKQWIYRSAKHFTPNFIKVGKVFIEQI